MFEVTSFCFYTFKQAVFLNKNLTNADNDNSMNISTKMEMSLVNKLANNVKTMQYVEICIHTRNTSKLTYTYTYT